MSKKKRRNKKTKNKSRSQPEKPTLSLCMIVKDEEKFLGRCLESVKDIMDEIIIVDTGSQDRTVAIARGYGAKVIHHQWQDDFAAARNEALKHATGQWILMLDADEELDEVNKKKLLQIVKANQGMAYFLNFRSPISNNAAGTAFINIHPRLFKNHPGIYFEGRVHEQIFTSVKKLGASIQLSDVMVYHHGYCQDKKNQQDKLERNLRLLQKQLKEQPDSAFWYFHLGETFSLLKKIEEAIRAYEQAITLGNIPAYLLACAHQNLACAWLKKREFTKVMDECSQALALQSSLITPHFLMAYASYSQGDYDKAILECQAYLEKASQNEKRKDRYFELEPNYGFIYTLLGHCYARGGNFAQAEESYHQALSYPNRYVETYASLGEISLQTGRTEEAICFLETAVRLDGKNPQLRVALAKAYFLAGNELVQQHQLDQAEQCFLKAKELSPRTPAIHHNLAVIDIKRKDYESAIIHFVDLLKIEPTNVEARRKLRALYLKRRSPETPSSSMTDQRKILAE
ncbi:MAG: glycosyltransferase [candidate division KSB1 bacterium]|nr:glycosyltransferase [candidate division KSB1 bacterium]